MTSSAGWIGVDLDATLAHYDGWKGIGHIGEPIPRMVERVQLWLCGGADVRIFTARVCVAQDGMDIPAIVSLIQDWTERYIGKRLPVTNRKDFQMIELWDDRCVQVVPNTGICKASLGG